MEKKEISLINPAMLGKEERKEYIFVDLRGEEEFSKGKIPGSVSIIGDNIKEKIKAIAGDKKIILYAKYEKQVEDLIISLNDEGVKTYGLEGGFSGWLVGNIEELSSDPERKIRIEKSIDKKFRKELRSKFTKAIIDYDLLKEGDCVAVCISGGKDSMLLAKLFQNLKKQNKYPFSLKFICMDPGYNEINRKIIEENCRLLSIPIEIFETEIFDAVYNIEKSPCYLCARMRRGYLYSKARELGCNKIALGHHFDDVVETVLMGMLYSGQYQGMIPKLKSTNFEGLELIRPMYYIEEDDIIRWRDYNDLNFIECACRFTEDSSKLILRGENKSKRLLVKHLIKELRKDNDAIAKNIFRSTENIMLDTLLGYKKDGIRHSFLENYEKKY